MLDFREKRCNSGRRPSRLAVHPFRRVLLAGSGAGVGDCRGAVLFLTPAVFLGRDNPFFKRCGLLGPFSFGLFCER